MRRKDVYLSISERLGWPYHTSNIRTIEEARKVYKIIRELSKSWTNQEKEKLNIENSID